MKDVQNLEETVELSNVNSIRELTVNETEVVSGGSLIRDIYKWLGISDLL